jgi:hypothetical protein
MTKFDNENNLDRDNVKERILSLSLGEGIKYGILGSALVGAATVTAAYRSKKFNQLTSVSAKVSFPVMAGLFSFAVNYELTMNSCLRSPEKWGLVEYAETGKVSTMPIHHKVLNAIYDQPFKLIAFLGVPFAGYVLSENMKLKHLTLSQKVMHSRVFAQAGIISILMTTMAFREYMDRHGRFPEPGEERVPKKQT